MSKSKAPTKVNVRCLGPKKYEVTWNQKEKYSEQVIEYGYGTKKDNKKGGKDFKKTLSGGKTSFTFTIDAKFFPDNQTKLTNVWARVKGKAKKKSYSSFKKDSLKINTPTQPNIGTIDTNTSTTGNATIFAWSSGKDKTEKGYPHSGYQIQRLRQVGISDNTEKYFKKLEGYYWNHLTNDKYKYFKDNDDLRQEVVETLDSNKSVTTIFRVRAVGPAGPSDWQYLWHVYGKPRGSQNLTIGEVATNDGKQTIDINLSYNAFDDANNPVDQVLIMYYIGVPDVGLALPSGASFTQYGDPLKPTTMGQHIRITLNQVLPRNNCMWVRIDTKHDANYSYGTPELALIGKLADPSNFSMSPDNDTHVITVSVTNEASAVPDSFIACTYMDSAEESEDIGKIFGIIPHGQNGGNIQCPDWTDKTPVGLTVKAYGAGATYVPYKVDNITTYTIEKYSHKANGNFSSGTVYVPLLTFSSGISDEDVSHLINTADINVIKFEAYTSTNALIPSENFTAELYIATTPDPQNRFGVYYKIVKVSGTATPSYATVYYQEASDNEQYMESDSVSTGASIPLAPKITNLKQVSTGMQVTWENQWDGTDGTEVLWADHEDALYSTNGPSSYEVDNIRRSLLNISGISAGVVWYVWLRSFRKNADGNKTYSLYSDVATLDLATVPDSPYLEMIPDSKAVTLEDDFTVKWTYYSEDEQPQESAKLYELTYDDNNNPVYSDIPNGTTNQEHFDITKEIMKEMQWTTDSVHYICVKLWSASGKETDYSNPLEVTVAPKPTCAITDISMDYDRVVEGEETYSGNMVYFDGGDDPTNLKLLSGLKVTFAPISVNSSYAKFTGCEIFWNGEGFTVDWSTRAENVYGGYFDYRTGVLASLYDSSGSLLTNPKYYNLGTSDLNLVAGQNECYAVVRTDAASDEFTYNNGVVTFTDASYSNGVITIGDSLYRDGAVTSEGYIIGQTEVKTATNLIEGYILTELPLDFTVIGAAGTGGTYITIARNGNYPTDRPDDTVDTGADGEVVFQTYYETEDQQTLTVNDFWDILDDGAWYTFTAQVQNSTTEQLSDPQTINFIVMWEEQAVEITEDDVIVEIDSQREVAYITPNLPTGGRQTDHVDIYRLSGDKPELIFAGAQFGQTIVDMYPTIGKRGGYRVVYITKNGDYIYVDPDDGAKVFAWVDITEGASLDTKFQYIDFDDNQLQFKYNVSLSNAWKKSFTMTKYLGGAIQGDWDVSTERTISISGDTFDDLEPEVYDMLRDLGDYEGICHVRTIDGSNFTANIEVSSDNSTFNSLAHKHSISMNVTRVDNPVLDGMTYEEWARENEVV